MNSRLSSYTSPENLNQQDTVRLVPSKELKFKEVPYQKLERFIASFGSYRSKTLKKGQIFVLNGQNFT